MIKTQRKSASLIQNAASFTLQFINKPKSVGALVPSSDTLAKLITNVPDLKNSKTTVEFGPGTGVFTQKILEKKSQSSLFFSIELNEKFVKETKKKCPEAIVYLDNARNLKNYLAKHGVSNCDCVISGLPFATFNKITQIRLIKTIHSQLSYNGEFVTFAYVHGMLLPSAHRFRTILQKHFRQVKRSKVVYNNIPPAFIYHCRK